MVFILGLCFGSFFNVAIHRWPLEDPKEREWVSTPSHCPKCGKPIRWFDNIPLVSYFILLRGKCRDCKEPISIRYPLVELGTALFWVLTTWLVANVGLTGVEAASQTMWHIVFALFFASAYLLTFIIDLETGLIPYEITIPNIIVPWLFMWICHGATISPDWQSSLIGMFVLSVFFLVLWYFGAMGDADILLVAGFGILFGWKLVLTSGFMGIFIGGIIGMFIIARLKLRKQYKLGTVVHFGPFLVFAAYICLFYGNDILNWYLSLYVPASRSGATTAAIF